MRSLIVLLARKIGFNPLSWIRDTAHMCELVRAFKVRREPKIAAVKFAVVVTPWLGTRVPWFALVCGLLLASKGNKVTFIVDDLPFGAHRVRFCFVLGCIRSVFGLLRGQYNIIHLSDYRSGRQLKVSEQMTVDRLAHLNATWALRGEMSEVGRKRYTSRVVRQLSKSYGAINNVMQREAYDAIVVPGGVYGSTGVWTEHARALGVRVASYDSGGYGTLMLAADGIACQLQDIPRAFSMLETECLSKDEHAFVTASAYAEMDRRRSGVDKFTSQIGGTHNIDARFDGAVIVALNSSWDSAALGLHAVFESSTQWIVETAKYLLANTPNPVIVRQHPAERLEIARTSDDYRALLSRHFGNHPRLHFVAADAPVNSYELLEQASAIAVYTSTIGVEAAAYGKVVVTPSHSYYSDLGFVWKAASLLQYYEQLLRAASGRYSVTPAMQDDALCCYYLTQCCNWVFSPFNPEGFVEWSRYSLADLILHEQVQTMLQSLEGNVPVAFLNHLAKIRQQSRPL